MVRRYGTSTSGVPPARGAAQPEPIAPPEALPTRQPVSELPAAPVGFTRDAGVRAPSAVVATRAASIGTHPFVEGIREPSARNARALRAENLKLLAREPDPEAALQKLEDDFKKKQHVLIRRSAKGFEGMLRDRRMKSVYEEPGKREPKYLEYREEVERSLGLFEYRPAYGYLSAGDDTRPTASEYGDVILSMKNSVKPRVAFCRWDSFDRATRAEYEEQCATWDDVAQLHINQQLTGELDQWFVYDEAQIFAEPGAPSPVMLRDLGAVAIPVGAEYDALAEKAARAMPWAEVSRYEKRDPNAGG